MSCGARRGSDRRTATHPGRQHPRPGNARTAGARHPLGARSTATFFAPEIAHADAVRWVPHILEDRGKGGAVHEALGYLEQLRHVVLPVPEEAYVERRDDSFARIGARDPDDWHIVATALVLDTPIWTEDKDFFGTGIPTWTTDRIELYLIRRI